jgi:polyisoprenoid-binding protein YceI
MIRWEVDTEHTQVRFGVKYMGISTVKGEFTDYDIEVVTPTSDFSQPQIEVHIAAHSISTQNIDRDAHLIGPDFFNVNQYPFIDFTDTKVDWLDPENGTLSGMLTICGISRKESFVLTFGGVMTGFDGETRAGFTIEGKINRQDYGLKWNQLVDNGIPAIADTVNISIDIELIKVT